MQSMGKAFLTLSAIVAFSIAAPADSERPHGEHGGGEHGQHGGEHGHQGGGGHGHQGGWGSHHGHHHLLLMNKSVRDELKVTDEQLGKLINAGESMRAKYRGEFAKLHDIKDEKARHEKAGELRKAAHEEGKKTVAGILSPEQLKRLRQIRAQMVPPLHALSNPETQKEMKLTSEQTDKIKKIHEDMHHAIRDAYKAAEAKRHEAHELAKTKHKEALEQATALLNGEQKAAWKERTGEPFKIKWEHHGQHGDGPGHHEGGPGHHEGGPGHHEGGPGHHEGGHHEGGHHEGGHHEGGPGHHEGGKDHKDAPKDAPKADTSK